MTCKHTPGDPACSSHWAHPNNPANVRAQKLEARTPDKNNYEILEAARFGKHLVLKVQYPNCSRCSYEGTKVMVFLNISEMEALKWKEIDPHFRDGKGSVTAAPSPAARFPASPQGWNDAVEYAKNKQQEDEHL